MIHYKSVLFRDNTNQFFIGKIDNINENVSVKIETFLRINFTSIPVECDDLGLNEFYIVDIEYEKSNVKLTPQIKCTLEQAEDGPIPLLYKMDHEELLQVVNDALPTHSVVVNK